MSAGRRKADVVRHGILLYEVVRVRADGTFRAATWHWTRRGADRVAEHYRQTGEVKGHNPDRWKYDR